MEPESSPAVPQRPARMPESTEGLPDNDLARRAALGDRAAFAAVFDRHAASMYRYAVGMLDGDVDAAEDAVQEAWAAAWRGLPGFRGESQLRTWLFTITARQVLAARRHRRPIAIDDELLSALPAPSHQDPARETERVVLWHQLELALNELPWRQRAVWLLREVENLSYAEIGAILGVSSTVVRGQLHRARSTVEVRMAQWR